MDHDLVVIGGGIAGLGLARMAHDAGWRTRLIEAAPRLGGALHTWRLGDFWLELGAHTLYNSYGTLIALLEAAGQTGQLLPRTRLPYRLWGKEGPLSIAGQLHYGELARGLFKAPRLSRSGMTVADYFSALTGPRNWREALSPAFDAVICQEAAEFPADALFRRKPRRRGLPRSFTLPGGLETVIEALARNLDLSIGSGVQAIEAIDGGYAVRTAAGSVTCDRVALATGPAEAARLITTIAPEAAARLATIGTATVESLGVAVPAERVRLPPVAGLIGRGQSFFSVVTRDALPHPRLRGFTFHFRPGLLDAQAQRRVAEGVLVVPQELWAGHRATGHRLPMLRLGHADLIGEVDRLLPPSLALTGNYFAGLSIEDCLLRSRELFDRWHPESA